MKSIFVGKILALLLLGSTACFAASTHQASYVQGAGEVPLSVVEYGNLQGPAILFIHGQGQSHLSFDKQLHSALAEKYHLVAFDLRGHGNSGKPWNQRDYTDSRLWADDVAKVIAATKLVKPVIVSWSYGTLVAANYLRYYGNDNVQAMVMIGALSGLTPLRPGDIDMNSPLAKRYAETQKIIAPLTASAALEDNLQAVRLISSFLTARPMPPEWVERTVAIGAMLPQYVRPWLLSQLKDNSDLTPTISFPMLLMAGSEDPSTPRVLMERLAAALPNGATVSVYQGSGHSPFVEEPERFNTELQSFILKTSNKP